MSLAELERCLQDRVDRHPAATSIPMLDGYTAAIVAGPVSMPARLDLPAARDRCRRFQPWRHAGVRRDLRRRAAPQRHQQHPLTAPDRFEPMHRCDPSGNIDAHPWCQGFYAAMRLRLSAWAPLLDVNNVNHGLLLPILLYCRDDQARPLLGPLRSGRETEDFLRNAHLDIPAVVEALRQHWMPIRYARNR
ncbi:YecA family protein [Bradyrhizobium sp. ISRA435]|nr:YecA family protein [Bradyrhizobium sp. ISRA435]